jgi:hypothetical protein
LNKRQMASRRVPRGALGDDNQRVSKTRFKACVEDLMAAMDQSVRVEVERAGTLPALSGWIVSVGIRWCVLAGTGGVVDNWYVAVRIRQIRAVRVARWPTGEATVRPAAPVGVDPSSTGTLLVTAGEQFGVATVLVERGGRTRRWTGRVLWTVDKHLTLGCIDPVTLAPRRAREIRFGDISRVDFGAPLVGG